MLRGQCGEIPLIDNLAQKSYTNKSSLELIVNKMIVVVLYLLKRYHLSTLKVQKKKTLLL